MREDVHRDYSEFCERPLNKNQLIIFRDEVLGRKDLHPRIGLPFEEVLRECIEEADGISGKTFSCLKKQMVERYVQHQNRRTLYESECGTSAGTTTTNGGSNSAEHSNDGGSSTKKLRVLVRKNLHRKTLAMLLMRRSR